MATGEKKPRFRPDMTIKEALHINPEIVDIVFTNYGLGLCTRCPMNSTETIEYACCHFVDVELNELLQALETAVDEGCRQK